MISKPKIESRPEQPYASIRTQVTMAELGPSGIIPQLHDEVMHWLKEQGVTPSGAPILRYRVIDMANKLDLEMAWPTARKLTGNGRVITDVLPAGRYGVVLYTGPYEGSGLMEANGALIQWARDNRIQWDNWQEGAGDVFASRYETYITDPGDEPDPSKWETEVAIKIADGQ